MQNIFIDNINYKELELNKKKLKELLSKTINHEKKTKLLFEINEINKQLKKKPKNNNFGEYIESYVKYSKNFKNFVKFIYYIEKNVEYIDLLNVIYNNINHTGINDSSNIFYQHLLFDQYLHEENAATSINQSITMNYKFVKYCNNKNIKLLNNIIKIYFISITTIILNNYIIKNKIEIIDYYKHIILFSGYSGNPGHSIILFITKNINMNTYNLHIFNSGEGINYHNNSAIGIMYSNISRENTIKIIKLNEIFNNIEFNLEHLNEDLNVIYIKNELNKDININDISQLININNFYELIFKYTNKIQQFTILKGETQLSGSCSFYSQYYFLKYYFIKNNLDFNDFKQFLIEDAKNCLYNSTDDNKNLINFLYLLKKDYNLDTTNKVETIINNPTFNFVIDSNRPNLQNYYNEFRNIINQYYSNKNLNDFIIEFYENVAPSPKEEYYNVFLNASIYFFYLIICDYFSSYKNINLVDDVIESLLDNINKIYIKYLLFYKNSNTLYDLFIKCKFIILDYYISKTPNNKESNNKDKKYFINRFIVNDDFFLQPYFLKKNIYIYLNNFDDNNIIFKTIYHFKILKKSCEKLIKCSIKKYDYKKYYEIISSMKLQYNFELYKNILIQFYNCYEDKYNQRLFFNQTKLINILNNIYNENTLNTITKYNTDILYEGYEIISKNYLNYDIIEYFIKKKDLKTLLESLLNFINNNYYDDDTKTELKELLKLIYLFINIYYKESLDKYNDILNKIYLKIFDDTLYYKILDNNYINCNIFSRKINTSDKLNVFILLNTIKSKIFIDGYFDSAEQSYYDKIMLSNTVYVVYVFYNLKLKYKYVTTNIVYLEKFPEINLDLSKNNKLSIFDKTYYMNNNYRNNILNLWKYNLQNGYILYRKNKYYIFLIINDEIENLLEKTYWIKNYKKISINIQDKYYLIELHYSLLFPVVNDDIEFKNEKLIVLFISLLVSKNTIFPLFFYNMINFRYIQQNIEKNKLFKLFYEIVKNKLIDSPFKLLYLKKFIININNDLNNNKIKDDLEKRKEYFEFYNTNNSNKKYIIELSEELKIILNNSNKNKINLKSIKSTKSIFDNIFNTLFSEKYIISLNQIYLTNYNDFYDLIYINYIKYIFNNEQRLNKDERNKLLNNIYNKILPLEEERSTEDILFEIHSKMLLRSEQQYFIKNIQGNYNEVQQLLMGSGKTSILTPLLILKYYINNNYKNLYVVLPEYLINQSYDIINSFMNIMNNFSNNYNEIFEYKDKNNYDYNYLNTIFITSDSTLKKNILNRIKINKNNENIINVNESFFIFDEIDSLINPLKSDLNIPSKKIKHPSYDIIFSKCINLYKEVFKKNNNIRNCNEQLLIYEKSNNSNSTGYQPNNNSTSNPSNNNSISNPSNNNSTSNQANNNSTSNPSNNNSTSNHPNNNSTSNQPNNNLSNEKLSFNINLENVLNLKIKKLIIQLSKLKYNKDYGFGDYINCHNELSIYNKNYFTAIPYNFINNPVNCSEFSDYEFLLILTINSYIENGKLRDKDIILINNLFLKYNKISRSYIELKYFSLIKLINKKEGLLDKIFNLDIDNNDNIDIILNEINSLSNIIDIIYSYIEEIIYPTFFNISIDQYNISMVDILGGSFVHNKITFSGTVDFLLPSKIINSVIIKNTNKISDAQKYCLSSIKEDNSLDNIKNAFFGKKTRIIPKIIYNNENDKNSENCLLKYLFDDNNIINYHALIDVGGIFIRINVKDVVKKIYETFQSNDRNINVIYINSDNDKLLYNGTDNKYNNEINDIFIYYDNKHTIGVDFKQQYKMLGLVTINNNSTLTEVAQGIFRLRNVNFGHNIDYFYNNNEYNSKNISLKYIYNKLVKNGLNRKLSTKGKMEFQCIKYINRFINKSLDSYKEYIYYDTFNQISNKIKSYQDYINYYVNKISKSINSNINPILIENNYNTTNVNIDIDIDIDINLEIQFQNDTSNNHKYYRFKFIKFYKSYLFEHYFDIEYIKKYNVIRYSNNFNDILYSRLKSENSKFYKIINNIKYNDNIETIKNMLRVNLDVKDLIEKSDEILSLIHIVLDKTIYYLSPVNTKDFNSNIYSLLIYNNLRLLLTDTETYEIISRLLLNDKKYNSYNKNTYIYNKFGSLIYGNKVNTLLLKDNEKLILFNIHFNIENTIKILSKEKNLYNILDLIQYINKEKYYFNIEVLKNNNIKTLSNTDYFKLFFLDINKLDKLTQNKFISIISKVINQKTINEKLSLYKNKIINTSNYEILEEIKKNLKSLKSKDPNIMTKIRFLIGNVNAKLKNKPKNNNFYNLYA